MPSCPPPPGLRGTRGPQGLQTPQHKNLANPNPRCSESAGSSLCSGPGCPRRGGRERPGPAPGTLQDSRADPPPWSNPRDAPAAIRIKLPCAGPGRGPRPSVGFGAHEVQSGRDNPNILATPGAKQATGTAGSRWPRSLSRGGWVCGSGDDAAAGRQRALPLRAGDGKPCVTKAPAQGRRSQGRRAGTELALQGPPARTGRPHGDFLPRLPHFCPLFHSQAVTPSSSSDVSPMENQMTQFLRVLSKRRGSLARPHGP